MPTFSSLNFNAKKNIYSVLIIYQNQFSGFGRESINLWNKLAFAFVLGTYLGTYSLGLMCNSLGLLFVTTLIKIISTYLCNLSPYLLGTYNKIEVVCMCSGIVCMYVMQI